jgi:hypothetical protein
MFRLKVGCRQEEQLCVTCDLILIEESGKDVGKQAHHTTLAILFLLFSDVIFGKRHQPSKWTVIRMHVLE